MNTYFKCSPLRSIAALLLPLILLGGCAAGLSPAAGDADIAEAGHLVAIEEGDVPLSASATGTLVPSQPGTTTYGSGGVTIDASNTAEGYISVKYTGSAGRVKVQITKSGGVTYTYDLRTDGTYEVLPFTQGSGSYTVGVFEHVRDSMYTSLYSTTLTVNLRSSTLPFLYPNQYVNFKTDSKVVTKAAELVTAADDELARVEKIYNYVIGNITYDTAKATSVTSGYLPVVDTVLSSGKGICFDYGSVMAAMLRSLGIPTRLEIGYVSGGAYHAWISVYLTDVGWVNSVIYFDGTSWKLMDPTFASSGNQSSAIMQYIGDGTNYSMKYCY